jgi:dihydroxyacetone kinase-like protein
LRHDQLLDDHGIDVIDAWIGEYCTSLDMEGCSITVMEVDEELKELIEYPVETPGLTIR